MDDPWSPRPGAPAPGPAQSPPYGAPTPGHGAPQAPPQYAPQPQPQPRPIAGHERPYWLGLLLAIVTLTFYHYWWHYLTHDEVCRQIGRPNTEKGLWFGYVGTSIATVFLMVLGFALFFSAIGPAIVDETVDEEQIVERMFAAGGAALVLFALGFVGALVATALLLVFAHKQATVLSEAFAYYGQPTQVSSGPFLGLYVGAMLGNWIIPGVGYVLMPIAYYTLQDPYNRFWRLAKYGEQRPAAAGYASSPGYGQTNPYAQAPAAPPTDTTRYAGTLPRQDPGPGQRPMGPYGAPTSRMVEQPFRCPRCHTHVTARGEAQTQVQVRCPSCGQSGEVMLGRA